MPAAPAPVITAPDPTIVATGNMFPGEVHKQIQAAIDAKNLAQTPAQPPAEAPPSSAPAASPAPAKPTVPAAPLKPAAVAPAVGASAASATPPADDPTKYPRSAIQWNEWKKKVTDEYEVKLRDLQAQLTPDTTTL